MITQLVNQGFKDQRRTVRLSGLDLFTSSDVNGVGKSSVLEAVKLALLGEIPGRAKTLEDILRFTSFPGMSVRILTTPPTREVAIERKFLRAGRQGERRPLAINQSIFRYEEGDRWVRETLGAQSLGFDPYEFLNLTDPKKRQWIIAHSPESLALSRERLRAVLFARWVEARFGSGLVREQLLALGLRKLEDLFERVKGETVSRFVAQLSEIAGRQDPDWSAQVRARLDRAFELWQEPDSAETNMARILSHLKAETTRIKHALDEQAGAISCLAVADPQGAENKAAACRAHIRQLDQEIENKLAKIESLHGQIGESRRSRARLEFLQENIDRLALELGSDLRVAIKARLQELEAQFADTQELQAELDRLHRELNTWTERYNREENSHSAIAEQLQFKRSQWRSLQPREHTLASTIPAEAFQCPIASEIRCETDMRPYREMLAREIKSLERREVESKSALARTREDLRICGGRVRDVQDQIRRRLAANDRLRQETRVLQEQCAGEERAQARAQGMLAAYREEAAALRAKAMAPDGPEQPDLIGMRDCLESEKRGLIKRKHDAEEALAILLREQGRASAAAELARQRKGLEAELKHVRLLARLLGPEGVQGEMAGRISRALGQEVNEMLRLIDTGLEFTLDLSGEKFLMGWNRDGRVIPFNTMNSAHFVLFIVPLLTALLNRMGRVRERDGLATLKVLCIEAESMSASNLIGLLKGLSLMKAKGFLDNALVAHYTSIRDPAKLHGFKEHILTAEGEASP